MRDLKFNNNYNGGIKKCINLENLPDYYNYLIANKIVWTVNNPSSKGNN